MEGARGSGLTSLANPGDGAGMPRNNRMSPIPRKHRRSGRSPNLRAAGVGVPPPDPRTFPTPRAGKARFHGRRDMGILKYPRQKSEEHTTEPQSLMPPSYSVLRLKKNT